MGKMIPRFKTGEDSHLGLGGLLQKLFGVLGNMGTATVISGQTAIVVTDAMAKTGDLIFASVLTKGTNAAYVVGTSISNGVSFTLTVNTDPGAGGAVIAYVRLPTSLLFST